MRKLLVIPGYCTGLGGMTVTLSLIARGFERCGASEQLCVLVRPGTMLEDYLRQAGQGFCLQLIPAESQTEFVKRALQWVSEQPKDWPLLLQNCVDRKLLPTIAIARLKLRGRPVYHLFQDLALSPNRFGNLSRQFAFACLSPRILCNSRFTAGHLRSRFGNAQGIFPEPVDIEQFNDRPPAGPPPQELQHILCSGARVMLTPTRISEPGNINDKNLRALLPVLAQLKTAGYHYHGVIVGEDNSPGQTRTQALLEQAESLGVADRFTVLPPTFSIQDYYKYADVVVTLSPREPFGRTVVEAIACGVPVIGSQTGGIGEILHNFAPGWTVEPNDPIAAAEAIVCIAADPNTPNILTKGKRWVEEQCGIIGYAQRMIEITGLVSVSRTVTNLLREEYSSFTLHKLH